MRTRRTVWQTLALVALGAWASAAALLSAPAPAPGVEHQKLEMFAGEWTFAGESKAVPALGVTDAGKVSYRHVNQMANGGFFFATRRTGTSARRPVTELFRVQLQRRLENASARRLRQSRTSADVHSDARRLSDASARNASATFR